MKPGQSSSLIKLLRSTVLRSHSPPLLALSLSLRPISSPHIPPFRSDRFPLQRHHLAEPTVSGPILGPAAHMRWHKRLSYICTVDTNGFIPLGDLSSAGAPGCG